MSWNDFWRFKGMRVQIGVLHVTGEEREVQETFEYAGHQVYCKLQKGTYPIWAVFTYHEAKKKFINKVTDPVVYIPCEVVSSNHGMYSVGDKYNYCYHVYDFQMITHIEAGVAELFSPYEIKEHTFEYNGLNGSEMVTVKGIYLNPKNIVSVDEDVYGNE